LVGIIILDKQQFPSITLYASIEFYHITLVEMSWITEAAKWETRNKAPSSN